MPQTHAHTETHLKSSTQQAIRLVYNQEKGKVITTHGYPKDFIRTAVGSYVRWVISKR